MSASASAQPQDGETPIHLTSRAIRRARRFPGYPAGWREAQDTLRLEVFEALDAGRVLHRRLRGFRNTYGSGTLKPGEAFAWTEDGERGFIILRQFDRDIVVLALERRDDR